MKHSDGRIDAKKLRSELGERTRLIVLREALSRLLGLIPPIVPCNTPPKYFLTQIPRVLGISPR